VEECDLALSDSCTRFRLNGSSFETPQKGGQSPEWRQSYRFALDDGSTDNSLSLDDGSTDNSLSLEVHCGTACSSASINLQSLSTSSFDGWLPLNGDFGGEVSSPKNEQPILLLFGSRIILPQ
jgi:hypothetical protein